MWNKSVIKKLSDINAKKNLAGGEPRILRQHSLKKLTARERVEFLLDDDSFVELGALQQSESIFLDAEKRFLGDGVVTGYGTIQGRLVYVCSQDFTIIGGTLGAVHSQKICRTLDKAIESKSPFICINDGGGARIEEGVFALDGYGQIFKRNVKASGLIPQISVILGPCAGGACYSPAIMDFIFMNESNGQMFITGPGVVKAETGETVSADKLGGADVHKKISGAVHFTYKDDESCLEGVKQLLSYLPQNAFEKPSFVQNKSIDKSNKIENLIPENSKLPFDVHQLISCIVDEKSFFEVQSDYAQNIVVGFARLGGITIGVIANQPKYLAGSLDVDASDKGARFVRFCDSFNIPLLTLVDVPGYKPGINQEHNGIIRHGAKLLFAFSEASVPKLTLIMRKAFGGAYIAMNSKNLGADCVFAWPIAQIAVMGAEGAVDIIHKKEIQASENPAKAREEFILNYQEKFLNPYIGASAGSIDEIIKPEETRKKLLIALKTLYQEYKVSSFAKKHNNLPM